MAGTSSINRTSMDEPVSFGERQPLLYEVTPQAESRELKGTWYSTFINLFLAAAGTGILSLPFTFAETGLVAGILMLLVMAAISAYSMDLLIRCAIATGCKNYEILAKKCYGRFGEYFVKINLLIFLFGAGVLFMIVFTALLQPFFGSLFERHPSEYNVLTNKYYLTMFGLASVFPLTMLSSLHKLQFTSTLGVVCLMYVLLVMIIRFGQHPHIHPTVAMGIIDEKWRLCLALPIQGIAFSAQFSVLPLFHELRGGSLRKMNSVIYTFSFACFLLYLMVAIFGYFLFGFTLSETKYQGNILLSFPADDLLINIARCLLAITILLKVPICSLPFKDTLNEMILPGKKIPMWLNLIESILYLLFAGGLAVIVSSLSIALGIMGGTSGVCISFIFPGALYLRSVKLLWYQKIAPVLMIIFGLVVGVLSIVFLFYSP